MSELWLPPSMVEVEGTPQKSLPDQGKVDGGSYFDDELDDAAVVQERVRRHMFDLIAHINARPDHYVYVSSIEDRARMRAAFNVWKRKGLINKNPTIKIEYGVPDGGIRVAE